MEKIDYKELSAKLFSWGIIIFLALVFAKYLLPIFVPFLIAWGIAYLIFPIANELSSKIKFSKKVCSFLLVMLLFLIIVTLGYLLINRLLFEGQRLFEYLLENSEGIAAYFKDIFDFFASIGERIPILNKLENIGLGENISKNVNELIDTIWKSFIERLGSAVPDFASSIVSALPDLFLVSLITVISCFYFSMDIELINSTVKGIIPKRVLNYLYTLKGKLSSGFKKYLKAYLIIFVITFVELFVGFLILGVDYSFVLALLIAFIDVLPVFGTAIILLPWGIILLMMKNYFLGIGMLILLMIITIVRQIIEPKILGKSLGVHPLITLVTLYIGYKVFGVVGMIFLPIVVIVFFSKNEYQSQK